MALFRANRGAIGKGGGGGGVPSSPAGAAPPSFASADCDKGSAEQDVVTEMCSKLGLGLQSQADQHQQVLNEWSVRLHSHLMQVQVRLDRILQLQSDTSASSTQPAPSPPTPPPTTQERPQPPDQRPPPVVVSVPPELSSFDGNHTFPGPAPARSPRPGTLQTSRTRDIAALSRAGSGHNHSPVKSWAMNEQTILKFSEDIDAALAVNTTKLCEGLRRCLLPHERECEQVLIATERVLALIMSNLGIVSGCTGGSEEQPAGFSLFDLPVPHMGQARPVEPGSLNADGQPGSSSNPAANGEPPQPQTSRSNRSREDGDVRGLAELPGALPGTSDSDHTGALRLASGPLAVQGQYTSAVEASGMEQHDCDADMPLHDSEGHRIHGDHPHHLPGVFLLFSPELPWLPTEGNLALRLFTLLEESPKSKLGVILEGILLLTIMVSTVSFIMESMPEFRSTPFECLWHLENNLPIAAQDCEPVPEIYFSFIEAVCIIIFTVEYLLRLVTVHADPRYDVCNSWLPRSLASTWVYMRQPLNIIDFLAVLPFYVDLLVSSSGGFRLLRLARTLRLFKIGKHHPGFRIFIDVLSKSGQPLAILAFFNVMVAIIFAALIYVAEGQDFSVDPQFTHPDLTRNNRSFPTGVFVRPTKSMDDQEPTPFRSIPYAMWWVFVTMTTVGYGDIAPTSRMGKVVGVMCFYVGIVFLALPISVITLNFELVYNEHYPARHTHAEDTTRSEKVVRRSHPGHPDRLLPDADGLRKTIFMLLDDPAASKLGRAISALIIITILVSTCSFVMESMPEFSVIPSSCDVNYPTEEDCRPVPNSIFGFLESISIAIFTMDYILRVTMVHTASPEEIGIVCRPKSGPLTPWRITWKYCTQWLNLIDLFAVLPFYIDLVFKIGGSTAVLRVLRLVRVFRVLKAPKLRTCVEMFQTVVLDSLPALVMLFLLTALMAIFFASCIMFAEGSDYSLNFEKFSREQYPTGLYVRPTVDGYDVEPSPFRSILYSLWWFFTTATTVGYGDDFPTTTLGRIVGVCSFYMGITLVALKLTAIGASFGKSYKEWVEEVIEPTDSSETRRMHVHNTPLKASPRSMKGAYSEPHQTNSGHSRHTPTLNVRSLAEDRR
mmetsp:Transcript_17340/g.40419  ORF Transcript_17340/g.40419 Transcript_17340/m.40419 type:complete len:1117 (-) Transcript_17340:167-3517(-)